MTKVLKPYRVSLFEEAGDKDLTLYFYCWAEDDDHADEQTENAYPACELIITTQLDPVADAVEINSFLGVLPVE